jgi:hypothetical protein
MMKIGIVSGEMALSGCVNRQSTLIEEEEDSYLSNSARRLF